MTQERDEIKRIQAAMRTAMLPKDRDRLMQTIEEYGTACRRVGYLIGVASPDEKSAELEVGRARRWIGCMLGYGGEPEAI